MSDFSRTRFHAVPAADRIIPTKQPQRKRGSRNRVDANGEYDDSETDRYQPAFWSDVDEVLARCMAVETSLKSKGINND